MAFQPIEFMANSPTIEPAWFLSLMLLFLPCQLLSQNIETGVAEPNGYLVDCQ